MRFVRAGSKVFLGLVAVLLLQPAIVGCHSAESNPNAAIPPAAIPQQFSYADWANFLSSAVTPDGYVKWDTVQSDDSVRQSLLKFVGLVNAVSPGNHPELFVGPRDALAYWINAFNAMTVYAVVEHDYPATMLAGTPTGAIFSVEPFTFGGSQMTLDELSRQQFDSAGDARVYFAINFGAASSPPLRNEPYDGGVLEEQLIDQTQRYLSDPRAAVRDGDAVRLNSLLLYMHKPQFLGMYQKLLGKAPGGILQALQPFALPDSPLAGATKVESLGFDWSLNRPPR